MCCLFFFFNDTATTEIYTLSLHDALPIFHDRVEDVPLALVQPRRDDDRHVLVPLETREEPRDVQSVRCRDRKSTRLNSSHANISYAVFCLKKKNNRHNTI